MVSTKITTKTWLITGCDKGMGREIAKAALQAGDRVAVTVLAKDGISDLTDHFPERCKAYHLDITQSEMIPKVVAQVEADIGDIDVVVNNAGYGLVGAAEETSSQDYRRMFEVNFFGATELIRLLLPSMRSRRCGHIINISSLVGFLGAAGLAYYSASKFALEGYSESLAKEVAPLGIRLTIIEPGGFRTDFAGTSIVESKLVIDDYASTSGAYRTFMKTRHGQQPGDPARLGKAIVAVATSEQPPLRLPLGSDAIASIQADVDRIGRELQVWNDLSASTDFKDQAEVS